MRPGIAPGRAAAAGVSQPAPGGPSESSRQLSGWKLAPANYATRDSARAGRGRRGQPVSARRAIRVSRQWRGGSSRPPSMRPGIAPGRAAAAGEWSRTRRAIRVSRQWRGLQPAPASEEVRAGPSPDPSSRRLVTNRVGR